MNKLKFGLAALLVLVAIRLWREAGTAEPTTPKASPSFAIVAYTASWCAPCQRDKPYLAELRAVGWEVTEVDIDAAGLEMSVPWYKVFKDGVPVFQTDNIREIQ